MRFGKYQLIKKIGGGQFSEVYLVSSCPDTPLHFPPSPVLVLKRIDPSFIGRKVFVQVVLREAILLAGLSHANLCRCHELGVVDGCAFFLQDFVDGCTLRALLRRLTQLDSSLPVSVTLAIACQLAEALDYLHKLDQPVAHLDLSPQNIMISRSGLVKLIDFGMHRRMRTLHAFPLADKVVGTSGYMSPEQASNGTLDTRSDQFGLGILLYEMLANERLFIHPGLTQPTPVGTPLNESPMESVQQQHIHRGAATHAVEAPAVVIDSLQILTALERQGVATELRAVVQRLLQPQPGLRFASMREVIQAIGHFTAAPLSGKKPLSALVQRFMGEPSFDPYDRPKPQPIADQGVPPIDVAMVSSVKHDEDYAELAVHIDRGAGTPPALLRELLFC